MRLRGALASMIVLAACGGGGGGGDDDTQAGGAATANDRTAAAFTHVLPDLSSDQFQTANAGAGQFHFEWSDEANILGPLYNNTECANCHGSEGRGLSQIGDGVLDSNGFGVSQALIRVSLGSGSSAQPGGPVPVPEFGLQLQDHTDSGEQEVNVAQSWTPSSGTFGDGTAYALRAPSLAVTTPDGLPFESDALQSYRQAPAVFGMGLLAAVTDDTIMANADPDDANGDGISGRPNMVWDVATSSTVIGRFGHKANQSTLPQQIAGAFANDLGIDNSLFPNATTGTTEISDQILQEVQFYLSVLEVPASAPVTGNAVTGRDHFASFGCTGCHLPTLETGDDAPDPALANQTIHPYTDLLLHDMGSGLADNRPDFVATGSEWRTPPLWGIGLVQVVEPGAGFLHDGRAQTIEEAILWHGGEAMSAREAYRTASKSDRDALIAFLQTL